jgi:hypothetical protein
MYHDPQKNDARTTSVPRRRGRAASSLVASVAAGVFVAALVVGAPAAQAAVTFPIESLNGAGNNVAHPSWGQAGTAYSRVAPARYADGRSAPVAGPNSRYVSNRIFDDAHQNIFSENRVSQWGWTWGQFLDHTFGLAATGTESADIPFNSSDPVESFSNTLGVIPFTRDAAAPGTGITNVRQATNTINSYLNASAVYGGDAQRLEWLRDGSVDNNVTNNAATLMMPGGYLPRRTARGNPATAPAVEVGGRLRANPNNAVVAGDVRANENLALTATQTLFAREHNRIAAQLPSSLSTEDRFQIARRVVIAEQQYITYNEFLPAMGVSLPAYRGYNPNVNTTLSTEFATIGYRAHSQIHGEFAVEQPSSRYSAAQLDAFRAMGIEVAVDGAVTELVIPLNVAFFNPDLIPALGLGPFLGSLAESQYNNDSMIDNQLRSVLFQVPVSGNPECLDGPTLPQCFSGVTDLGAIDIERGRDHGEPTYNQLRQAYGLAPKNSFTAITGESTESFPSDPLLTRGDEINDPQSLDFLSTADIDGVPTVVGDGDGSTSGVRRTTVAARLKAIYGNPSNVDGFSGMVAERHLPGTEFGELQMAIWRRQFQALRDGDRFFYGNDQGLSTIRATYGIDFRTTLAQVIARNTDLPSAAINPDVFLVPDDDLPAATCSVRLIVTSAWTDRFQVNAIITNESNAPINGWTVRWQFPGGQTFVQSWNGRFAQQGISASLTNASWNTVIPPGQAVPDVGFIASWDNATNPMPANITLNNKRCALA